MANQPVTPSDPSTAEITDKQLNDLKNHFINHKAISRHIIRMANGTYTVVRPKEAFYRQNWNNSGTEKINLRALFEYDNDYLTNGFQSSDFNQSECFVLPATAVVSDTKLYITTDCAETWSEHAVDPTLVGVDNQHKLNPIMFVNDEVDTVNWVYSDDPDTTYFTEVVGSDATCVYVSPSGQMFFGYDDSQGLYGGALIEASKFSWPSNNWQHLVFIPNNTSISQMGASLNFEEALCLNDASSSILHSDNLSVWSERPNGGVAVGAKMLVRYSMQNQERAIYVISGNNAVVLGYTSDGGITLVHQTTLTSVPATKLVASDDLSHAYVITDVLHRSIDLGLSYTQIANITNPVNISCSFDGLHVVVSTSDNKIHVTHDGFDTHTTFDVPEQFTAVDISNDGQTIIGGSTKIYLTTDGGTTIEEYSTHVAEPIRNIYMQRTN